MIFNKDLAFGYVASLYSIYVLAGCKQCDEMKNFNKKNIRKNASFLIRNCQFRLRFDWPQHIYKLIKYYIDRLDTVTRILKEKRPRNFEYYIDHVRLNWCDVFFYRSCQMLAFESTHGDWIRRLLWFLILMITIL